MAEQREYTLDDKYYVVMTYLVTGNMRKTSKLTGIPYATVNSWKSQEWWPVAWEECKRIKQEELDAKFTAIIHNSVEAIEDRLKAGDEFMSREGERYRLALKAKDLAWIAVSFADRRAMIRGEPVRRTETKQTSEKLNDLQSEFANFIKEKKDSSSKPVKH